MKLTGFQTYKLYNALKLHFTSSYDFFKYGGKTKVSEAAYSKRKDRFFFERLANKYEPKDLQAFLVANFLADRKWIGQFANDVYDAMRKNEQSLEYNFAKEVGILFEGSEPKQVFRNINNEYCKLISQYMRGNISLQTMVILNDFVGYVTKFDTELKDDFIWEQNRIKIVKYSPFLRYEKNKYKEIFSQKLLDNAQK